MIKDFANLADASGSPAAFHPLFMLTPEPVAAPLRILQLRSRFVRHETFGSAHVEPRNVDVWLPPGYEAEPQRRWPVVYFHDGQNLFLPELSFSGVVWGVDEAIAWLMEEEGAEGAIAVGIWNTPRRIPEYMPQRPLEARPRGLERFVERFGEAPRSDAYLRFLVEELKPSIDAAYRTQPEQASTFVVGSSMGGLVSLYALAEYPDVFGGAACLSTSWPLGAASLLPYLRSRVPDPATHRIYFDYGAEARLAGYESHQRRANRLFERAGYVYGETLVARHYPGAEHSEAAWRDRLDAPLRFLLTGQADAQQVRQAASG